MWGSSWTPGNLGADGVMRQAASARGTAAQIFHRRTREDDSGCYLEDKKTLAASLSGNHI